MHKSVVTMEIGKCLLIPDVVGNHIIAIVNLSPLK